MRNVLSSSNEVYHYFANKIQPSGRYGNISFALPRAYSYAACIGMHYLQGVALASRSWSVTTSRHQSDLRQACRHLVCVYVPDPSSVTISYQQVQLNVAALLRLASKAKAKRPIYLGDALNQVKDFNIFAEWCESQLCIESPVTDDAALRAIAAAMKDEGAAYKAAAAQRLIHRAAENAEHLTLWRTGLDIYLPCNLNVALRIKGDQIETSKGAHVPVSDAPLIWAMATRQKPWAPHDPVGVYRLTKIRADGSMVVGCHDVPFSELELIAKQLGFTS